MWDPVAYATPYASNQATFLRLHFTRPCKEQPSNHSAGGEREKGKVQSTQMGCSGDCPCTICRVPVADMDQGEKGGS